MAMTEEHKQKMAEGRRRAAEQKRAEKLAAEEQARLEAIQAKEQADAAAPDGLITEADTTPVQFGGQQEWGPFDRFTEVHTQYGLYGLSANTIMHFEEYETTLHGEPIISHRPIYRKVAKATA